MFRQSIPLNTTYISFPFSFKSLHILLLFKNLFFPLFFASHDTLDARDFRDNVNPHWRFIYYRKLIFIFGNLTLILTNTIIFVKTNNKRME